MEGMSSECATMVALTNIDVLQLLAYMFAFISFGGVLGWLATTPFWYRRLSSVLREAEAICPPFGLNP
jgi:hypothetical protein